MMYIVCTMKDQSSAIELLNTATILDKANDADDEISL